jgi:hypothetical protein
MEFDHLDIKPCPSCGGSQLLLVHVLTVTVRCEACGLEGPVVPARDLFDTRAQEKAVALWNELQSAGTEAVEKEG